jgi:protein SCO1/2
VQRQLDDSGEKIQTVMISVDPERDTPQQLAEYVTHFHPTFVGLTGSKEEIDAAAEAYGVYYEKHEGSAASGYLIDHTARVFAIDPQGNYQLSFSFGTPVEDIVHDLRLLMRSTQP